ncbi:MULTISPECIES: hypothetical protein [Xanthomonas]|uniref:Uncharacterized protein n=2 Tax=Xanthomonas TaxID=338 RepID=A0A0U4YHS0_XANCI|nr:MULTISPECIES: hypothetical protein [Xanthomonas]KGT54025.1 hypothetical protein NY96_19790 [Xanthomonas citri pv. fuscans]MDO6948473.1 hypothetical protein [Xanthomonas vasicola]MDO6960489.1 hypothetical protein [Xanthomonas vasicola]CEE63440.1 hypothetical protein XAC3608_2080024 [Xanthomonas citri pv. citri]CEG14764.1 hypothetical protein XAC3562_1200087 [Xanthomonas citri pv. citri]
MDARDHASTSWGMDSSEVDPRALRRWNKFLDGLANVGECLSLLLVLGAVICVLGLTFDANFENGIFYDGTDHTCLYDGKTGKVHYVE